MRMTVEEARQIGEAMLRIDRQLFEKSLDAARKVEEMRPQDLGPMTLVLAILGISKVNPRDEGFAAEMTDALALIDKAETTWRMMRKMN
jgi:hypothetical protein